MKSMTKTRDDTIRRRILLTARRSFFTFGYSKATMDELAIDLHMSKKTLYQFFQSKQVLLESVIYDFFQEFQDEIEHMIRDNNHRGLNIIKQFMSLVQSRISQFNIKAFEDIRKNNPRAWQIIIRLREKMINHELRELLKKGKKEGTVRKDIDLDIIVLVILNTVQSIAIPEVISQFSYSTEEVIEMIAKIVIGGISPSENMG